MGRAPRRPDLLKNIDLKANSKLIELNCKLNSINNLDLTHNKQLKELYCFSNQLSVLDLSMLKQLAIQLSNTVFNLLKITGDYHAFKGLPIPEGKLKVKDEQAAAALKEAAVKAAADDAEKHKAATAKAAADKAAAAPAEEDGAAPVEEA